MKKGHFITFVFVSVFIFNCKNNACGQSSPDDLIKNFFAKFEKEKPDSAIDGIYATNKFNIGLKTEIKNMESKLAESIVPFGKYQGNEFIVKKSVGESFVIYSYLIKYEREPIRFLFVFYKPKNDWLLYSFSYDSKLEDELKEASKAYRLSENLPFIPNKQ